MALTSDHGFSLIEVLLVIVIIAVLAAIAIPHYADTRGRSMDSRVVSVVRNVATGQEAFYAGHQHYADKIEDLDGIVVGNVAITLDGGNSGDLNTSFRVRGTAPGALHDYVWVSDPGPGEPRMAEAQTLS